MFAAVDAPKPRPAAVAAGRLDGLADDLEGLFTRPERLGDGRVTIGTIGTVVYTLFRDVFMTPRCGPKQSSVLTGPETIRSDRGFRASAARSATSTSFTSTCRISLDRSCDRARVGILRVT
jgi:hypothetical protein